MLKFKSHILYKHMHTNLYKMQTDIIYIELDFYLYFIYKNVKELILTIYIAN